MTLLLIALTAQALLGGLDNLLHHELTEKLPSRVSARFELALHGARELIYALVFIVAGWLAPHGLWAWALLVLMLIEIGITTADFIEEDRTRALPPFERTLHLILSVMFGLVLALAAPIWMDWAKAPTALVAEPRGLFTPLFTLFAVGVGAWGVRNAIASAALFATAHNYATVRARPSGRTLLITGATGFIGEALVRRQLAAGDDVIVLTRDPLRTEALFAGAVLPVRSLGQIPAATRIDGIVNLAGAGVAAAPWSAQRKRTLLTSRIAATDSILALIARLQTKPAVLVSASAVGFYGDRGEEVLTEHAVRGAGFTGDLCAAWEQHAGRASAFDVRVAMLRFGLVLGQDGGAWPRMTASLRFGLGAIFGDGRQFMAWIHKMDALRMIGAALENPAFVGPINAVAPQETRHGEVMRAAGVERNVGIYASAPAWLLNLALGEMAALFLDSQHVRPERAIAAGFMFQFPTIESAFADLMTKMQPPNVDAPWARTIEPAR